jgi:hypothetical protein
MESTIMMRFCSDAVVFFLRGHSQWSLGYFRRNWLSGFIVFAILVGIISGIVRNYYVGSFVVM